MNTTIEYSKDFNFFLSHQIMLSTTNNGAHNTFYSRLDGQLFKTIDGNKKLSDEKIKEVCKEIHGNLKSYIQ